MNMILKAQSFIRRHRIRTLYVLAWIIMAIESLQGLINKFTRFFCRNALSTDVHERIFASTIHIVVMVYGNAQMVMMRAAVRVSIMCNLFLIRWSYKVFICLITHLTDWSQLKQQLLHQQRHQQHQNHDQHVVTISNATMAAAFQTAVDAIAAGIAEMDRMKSIVVSIYFLPLLPSLL